MVRQRQPSRAPRLGSLLLAVALAAGCGPSEQQDTASVEVTAPHRGVLGTLDAPSPSTPDASAVPDVAHSTLPTPDATPSVDPTLTQLPAPSPSSAPPKATRTRPPSASPSAAAPAAPPLPTPQAAVVAVAAPVATSTTYSLHTNSDGSLARWDPCRPIHYRINLAGAPDAADADVHEAVRRVAEATGMTFLDDGTTDVIPTNSWLKDATDEVLVIAWSARSASDLFADGADGVGGWWETGTSKDGSTWLWRIVRGFVVIDVDQTRDYAAGFGTGVTRGALLMHELGHAVGLGHVDAAGQIMNPFISRSTRAEWGAGDLAGLALLGRGAGCLS